MQDTSLESKGAEKKIFPRVWLWILIGLVSLILFSIMLPVGINYGIETYLEDRGADLASLEDVNFNPFTGRMTLTNLKVIIGAQPVLKIPEATFKIEWAPFIRKRFVLERFKINNLDLIVAQLENGNWQIGSIILPSSEASAEPTSWGFSINEATATNCKIKLISSKLNSDLIIEQAKISKFTSWLYDDNARLEFNGKLNDSPMKLQLDVAPFGSELLASGKIKLIDLNLKPFSKLLQPQLKTLAGRLDLDLDIETSQAAGSGIDHFQKGSLELRQFNTHMADMVLSNKDLAWNGAVLVNLTKSGKGLNVSADGQLNGSKLTLNLENENLMLQQDKISWKGKINYAQDNTNQNINTDGQIDLVDLKMESPDLNLTKEKLVWKGEVQVLQTAKAEGRKIIVDGQVNGSKLQFEHVNENLKVYQDNFSWKGKVNYDQDHTNQEINTDGQIDLVDLKVESPDLNLTKEKLVWKGEVQVLQTAKAEGQKIIVDGQVNGSKLQFEHKIENLKVYQDNFSWKGKIDYDQDHTNQNINTFGQIDLVDLKMESSDLNLAEEKLAWKGALQFSLKSDTETRRILTDGILDGSHLQMSLPGPKLQFEHNGLFWKGRLNSGSTNDFAEFKAEGDFILRDIQILQSETNQRLLNTNQCDLQSIQIDSLNEINVSGIVLNGLALLAAPEADSSLLRIQEIKFENARLSQQKSLDIDAVWLAGVKGFLHRNNEGKWPAIDRLVSIRSDISSADQTQPATSDIQANEKSDEFDFRIGQIDISGDSGLQFKDDSVSPSFDMDLKILEAHVADLDSRQPQKPAPVKLLLSDQEDARISLDGSMKPLAEKLSLNWVGKIEALELPPLSPYAIQNTGFRFVSGELQADIPMKINQNQIDGQIDLMLFKPKVERVKAESSAEKNQGKMQIRIPLDSGLKLMSDKQNNVKLNIPLTGNITDPQFSIADAVNKVLVKTLQNSTLSYLKFVLGPYGIGLAVAEKAISGTARIRLNPIIFEPGSEQLDEEAIDYAQRVATIMNEYPEVQVIPCGVATESDRLAIMAARAAQAGAQSGLQADTADAELLALAKQRSGQIKNHLVKVHGINPKRIIGCGPKITKGDDAKPRVDLGI